MSPEILLFAIKTITMNVKQEAPQKMFLGVPLPVFWLGVVSFLTDISSEMIFSVLAVFLTVILGASSAVLGLMEGIADFAASSLDYLSGYLSDRTGKRKLLTLFGYAFSTLAKILLVFATTVSAVITFRVVERLGKSVRGAPRDALISSLADKKKLGFVFGFHKTMDKAGAVLGPIIAYLLLSNLGDSQATFNLVFWTALFPALLAVIILGLFVKEGHRPVPPKNRPGIFSTYKLLEKDFRRYLKIAGLFSLSYFSFAFLLLKGYEAGFQLQDVPLLYALFNVTFIFSSIPIGKLGDRIGRHKIIASEYLLYALICLGLMLFNDKIAVALLIMAYGVFYAIDEGHTRAYISGLTAETHRASALGLYNFITGLMYIPASIVTGLLWNYYSPAHAFGLAAIISLLALIFFLFVNPKTLASQKQHV